MSTEFNTDLEYELRKLYYYNSYYPGNKWNGSGWSNRIDQFQAYSWFLPHFTMDGNIIDLGCGDGALLRFIIEKSGSKLVPFGVDFLEDSIACAKATVLPQFQENFFTENIHSFNAGSLRFAYILANPFYITKSSRQKKIRDWLDWLLPGGKLILYEYKGSPGFESLQDFEQNLKFHHPTIFIKNNNISLLSIGSSYQSNPVLTEPH